MPMQNHAMFSLFLRKSLPTISGEKVVRIHGDKTILAVRPESSQFTELSEAQLQSCAKVGENYLCSLKHTWTSDPSTSCLAAIYYQDAASIELQCKVSTEPAKFTLERLNGTSFVSVAQQETTAQIQCDNRGSVHQLLGTQIGTLKHSCSITAGHSAMASNRERADTGHPSVPHRASGGLGQQPATSRDDQQH